MHTLEGVVAVPALSKVTSDRRLDEHGMYRKVFTRARRCKHSQHCEGAFGRYDYKCYRCAELAMGAAARDSSHAEYFRRKLGLLQRSFEF